MFILDVMHRVVEQQVLDVVNMWEQELDGYRGLGVDELLEMEIKGTCVYINYSAFAEHIVHGLNVVAEVCLDRIDVLYIELIRDGMIVASVPIHAADVEIETVGPYTEGGE